MRIPVLFLAENPRKSNRVSASLVCELCAWLRSQYLICGRLLTHPDRMPSLIEKARLRPKTWTVILKDSCRGR